MAQVGLSGLGECAVELTKLGWQVFRLSPRSKVPLKGSSGLKDATDDEDDIRRLWLEQPDANIGVVTGELDSGGSGLWSLDFDKTPDKDGMAVRAALEAEHGPLGGAVLKTHRGVQHIYTYDDRSPTKLSTGADGVDIRSNGGYFLAPCSVHPSGDIYAWGEGKPETAPGWLIDWLKNRVVPPASMPSAGPTHEAPPSSGGARPYSPETFEEYRQMLGYIPGIVRDDWLRVGFAIHELGWGRHGFDLWDAWSQNWPDKYAAKEQGPQWSSFSRHYTDSRTTIASVVREARLAGWRPPSSLLPDDVLEPIRFFDRDEQAGPPISIEEVFGDAPRFSAYLNMAWEYLQVPESTLALAHLTGVSAVISKRLRFDNGKFTQPPPLWLLSLIRTGGRKSEIVDLVREPIIDITTGRQARELQEGAIAHHQMLEEQLTNQKSQPTPDPTIIRNLYFELVRNRGKTVDLSSMVASDTTEAALQGSLLDSGGSVFICDGEPIFLNNAISPLWAVTGAAPQTTTPMNGYSGKSILVNRANKKRRQGVIKKPELAICLVVQTGAPTDYLFDNPHLRDSGFMARFMINVPDFRPEDIRVDVQRPSKGYAQPWIDLARHYLLQGIPLEPRLVEFHQDARALFLDWRRVHQKEFRPGGANHDLVEFHNKAHGLLTRVAGALAAARAFEEFAPGSAFVVEVRDVERAISLFTKLVQHARLAFGLELDSVIEREALRALHAAFKSFPTSAFSRRDLVRRVRVRQIIPVMEILVETFWLIPTDERKWQYRDPRTKFRLNPGADIADAPLP